MIMMVMIHPESFGYHIAYHRAVDLIYLIESQVEWSQVKLIRSLEWNNKRNGQVAKGAFWGQSVVEQYL